jgi:hypothetical protein
MWPRSSLIVLISAAAIVFAALYVAYRLVDPLPPRHLVIAAGLAGSGYDKVAKRYAKILARHGVDLEIRNSAGAVEDLNLLRNPASGVQAAVTTFGFTEPADLDTLRSAGYSTPRFSFSTGIPSRSPCSRNSTASALPSACRGPPSGCSSWTFCGPPTLWMAP